MSLLDLLFPEKLTKVRDGYYRFKDKTIVKEEHPLERSYYMIWSDISAPGEFERVSLDGLKEVRIWLDLKGECKCPDWYKPERHPLWPSSNPKDDTRVCQGCMRCSAGASLN